jgi:hypothetical protein
MKAALIPSWQATGGVSLAWTARARIPTPWDDEPPFNAGIGKPGDRAYVPPKRAPFYPGARRR